MIKFFFLLILDPSFNQFTCTSEQLEKSRSEFIKFEDTEQFDKQYLRAVEKHCDLRFL